ncbi:MAG: DUF3276 family protein [Treponema sp.]|jgi:hypothetical protein|nr:DUF3276 family protein [Treponema sp.]
MGIRGEVYSTKVQLPNRTYFFNIKENRLGDLYLNVVESKNRDEGGFERQSVVVFAEDLTQFLSGFEEALRVMDKAGREKRHSERDRKKPFKHQHADEEEYSEHHKKSIIVRKKIHNNKSDTH